MCKTALDKSSPRNWLDDNIWLKKAYLEWRSPLLIHSNWWLAFLNDDSIPQHVLREPKSSNPAKINPWQVRRAAWLAYRHLEFKDSLARFVRATTSCSRSTYLLNYRQEIYSNTTRTGELLLTRTLLPSHRISFRAVVPGGSFQDFQYLSHTTASLRRFEPSTPTSYT